jgi:hypothetical protein
MGIKIEKQLPAFEVAAADPLSPLIAEAEIGSLVPGDKFFHHTSCRMSGRIFGLPQAP